jgi:hypothetical protein
MDIAMLRNFPAQLKDEQRLLRRDLSAVAGAEPFAIKGMRVQKKPLIRGGGSGADC